MAQGVWWRSSTLTMVITRRWAEEPLPPTLTDISLRVMLGSGHIAVGGLYKHSCRHEWQLTACTSLGQTWEVTHVAGGIYAIEPFAYDHDNAEAQSYSFS